GVDEPGDVIAAALGEQQPVQAAAAPVFGHVTLAHAWPGQVPGEQDHSPGWSPEVFDPPRQRSGVPERPAQREPYTPQADYDLPSDHTPSRLRSMTDSRRSRRSWPTGGASLKS